MFAARRAAHADRHSSQGLAVALTEVTIIHAASFTREPARNDRLYALTA